MLRINNSVLISSVAVFKWAAVNVQTSGCEYAVQGHSGVSYGVGYLAQTRFSIFSTAAPGGITVQSLSSPAEESIVPPAIGSVWAEMERSLKRALLQSYSRSTLIDAVPFRVLCPKFCNCQT